MFEKTRNIIFLIVLIGAIGLFSITEGPNFLSITNLQSMLFQIPEFGMLVFAIMVSVLTGGIDLSIVSTATLSGIIAALVMIKFGSSGSSGLQEPVIIFLAVLAAIVVSVICGSFNGILIGFMGISPILVTLGTSKLFEGISLVLTKGEALTGFPEVFLVLGSGTVSIIPVPFVIFLFFVLIISLFLSKTVTGFNVFMLGVNPIVARYSGINTKLVLLKAYMLSGFFCGIAALIIISRVNSIKVGYGSAYLLRALLVVILGGVSPSGGFGSVSGVLLGIFILQVISSGLSIMGVNAFLRNVVWGSVLILVMISTFLMTRFKNFRELKLTMK